MKTVALGKAVQIIRLMVLGASQRFFTWISRAAQATDSIMDKNRSLGNTTLVFLPQQNQSLNLKPFPLIFFSFLSVLGFAKCLQFYRRTGPFPVVSFKSTMKTKITEGKEQMGTGKGNFLNSASLSLISVDTPSLVLKNISKEKHSLFFFEVRWSSIRQCKQDAGNSCQPMGSQEYLLWMQLHDQVAFLKSTC